MRHVIDQAAITQAITVTEREITMVIQAPVSPTANVPWQNAGKQERIVTREVTIAGIPMEKEYIVSVQFRAAPGQRSNGIM